MAFKFVLLFASLAAVNAGVIEPAGHYQHGHTAAIYPQHSHTDAIFPQQASYVKQAAYVQPAYVQQAAYVQPAPYVQPAAHVIKQAAVVKHITHEEPANYEFNYEVHDEHTGDIKRQHEKAINGAISGQYSLYDADGYHRIVDYTADDHNGFVANVRREPIGHGHGPQIVKTIQPAIAVQKFVAQPTLAVQKVVAHQPAHNPWQAPSYVAQSNPWG